MTGFLLALSLWLHEPPISYAKDWEVNRNGNICLTYDLTGDGKNNLMTCHTVQYHEGTSTNMHMCITDTNNLVCLSPMHMYVAKKHPQQYHLDIDGDGVYEVAFIDIGETGDSKGFTVLYDKISKNSDYCEAPN